MRWEPFAGARQAVGIKTHGDCGVCGRGGGDAGGGGQSEMKVWADETSSR